MPVNSDAEPWFGYTSAVPITSAPWAVPSIWVACAAPAVGVKTTTGPFGAASI